MVDLPMTAARTPAGARRGRAAELLDALGVADCADRRPAQLSGGQQMRVAIAVALANQPRRSAGRRADRRAGHGHLGRGVRGVPAREPANWA